MFVYLVERNGSVLKLILTKCPPLGLTMVLTAAFEFDPRSNKEATIRPTDNVEVPQVRTKESFVLAGIITRGEL